MTPQESADARERAETPEEREIRTRIDRSLAERHRIMEVRPAGEGEMYRPDTPWRRQDNTPRQVPELDADDHRWQITADGRHVGTHHGSPYCLEWLPTELKMPPIRIAPLPAATTADPADLPSGPFAVEQAILDRWARDGEPSKPVRDPQADPWAWPGSAADPPARESELPELQPDPAAEPWAPMPQAEPDAGR